MMMEPMWGFGAAAGIFAFFGGVALLMWIESRNKRFEREVAHKERIKSLEMGHPLPDAEVAKANAQHGRAWVLGLVCFIVPGTLMGTATGATALVFTHENTAIHLPLTCTIWGITGLISLVTVATALGAIAGNKPGEAEKEGTGDEEKDYSESIREHANRG